MQANGVVSILERLADLNQYGFTFLMAFGLSWVVSGLFWKKASNKTAGYVTLFQGMVALPVALLGSYAIGAFAENVGGEIFTQLIITVAMSQLLILPLVIVMTTKEQYTLVPFVFSASLTIHFVIYSWLYQTWLYIAMPVVISIGVAIIYALDVQTKDALPSGNAAANSCLFTGVLLLFTAFLFLVF